MNAVSAGLLMFRKQAHGLEYFLVHPGGPFFTRRHEGVWSIPKGLPEPDESLVDAACREFFEETGIRPVAPFIPLGSVRQKSGKVVHAWAFEGHWDPESGIQSNTFEIEWPPPSGKRQAFPEQDRAAWMTFAQASTAINAAQLEFLKRLNDYRSTQRS